MNENGLDILDLHYAVISSDSEEVVIDGITKSYCLKEGKLHTNKIDVIKKSFKTEKIKKKTVASSEIKNATTRTTTWHLAGTRDLGNKQTKVGHINICGGVTGSAELEYGTSYSISGGSVVSVTLTQSSSQSYGLSNMTSFAGYRYDLYSTFHYVEEYWVSDVGEMYKIRADSFVGGLTKTGMRDTNNSISYSVALTMPNARQMGSPGSYNKQVSSGISVSSAASIASNYLPGTTYTVGLVFTSSYSQSFHIDLASTYSSYCIYGLNDYVVHN